MAKIELDLGMSGTKCPNILFTFTNHLLHEGGDLTVGSFMTPSLQFCKWRE